MRSLRPEDGEFLLVPSPLLQLSWALQPWFLSILLLKSVYTPKAVSLPCMQTTHSWSSSICLPLADTAASRFLLKYVSRDVVALLHKGTGGVVEIRSTITAYEEKSPLYGFLQYRRRKIILRYVPEGISRLIQGIFFNLRSLSFFVFVALFFFFFGSWLSMKLYRTGFVLLNQTNQPHFYSRKPACMNKMLTLHR